MQLCTHIASPQIDGQHLSTRVKPLCAEYIYILNQHLQHSLSTRLICSTGSDECKGCSCPQLDISLLKLKLNLRRMEDKKQWIFDFAAAYNLVPGPTNDM